MKSTDALVDDCLSLLVGSFPVEDVWHLDSRAAKDCLLDEELNLVILVAQGANASSIEREARALMRRKFPRTPVGIHVYSQTAMFQTPRPLLVKMAFTSGSHIYCG